MDNKTITALARNAMSQDVAEIITNPQGLGHGQGGPVLEDYLVHGKSGRSCTVYRTATGWHVGSVWED